MSHSHQDDLAGSGLKVAFLLNVGFTVLEIIGGFWTNSIAILADALHDSGDCLSLGVAWYLQRLSQRGPDARFTYGYRRFSVLGALITGLVLAAGLMVISWSAMQRLGQPEEVKASGMLGLAIVGIAFNGIAAWILRGGRSLNEKVATWHLLEDTMGWGAVLLGSAVMVIWDLPIIDPILSLLISAFVLWNVIRNLKKVVALLLQQAPAGFSTEDLETDILAIPKVVGIHHAHTWTLDGEHHIFSTHLVMVDDSCRGEVVVAKRQIYELLREQGFEHVTVEVELEGEECFLETVK